MSASPRAANADTGRVLHHRADTHLFAWRRIEQLCLVVRVWQVHVVLQLQHDLLLGLEPAHTRGRHVSVGQERPR